MKRIIISFFAAAALVGCAKELAPDQSADQVTVKPGPLVEFSTSFADAAQSRVALDHQTGKLSWSEGDKVAVVLTDGTNYSYDETTYTVNHQTGTLEIPDNSAYVIYPASQKGSLSGTKLTLSLPSTHSVKTPEDAFDNALMKGVVNGNKVEFKNLFGFFKVPVTGEGKLKSAVLRTICRTTSDFHPISKSATLDLSKDATSADGAIKMATNNAAFSWVRYNFSEEVDLSAGQDVYFAVPAGEYQNMGIVLVTDKGSNTFYATTSHEVSRSSVKPVSSKVINLADRTPKSPVSIVGTTDDPQEKYANCYMVPPTAGSYEFDCILADGTNLKGGVTAEIKWAEQAGLVNDLYYNPETNKISFKTNGTEGNALVVLTNNTDDSKTPIWTWHIWITDTPKVLNIQGHGNTNQYYVMDRVLGATWAPASTIAQTETVTWDTSNTAPINKTIASSDASDACGVYFQYQNRIPFPRLKNIDDMTLENKANMSNTRCDVMYGFSQWGQYWTASSGAGEVWKDTNNQYIHNNFGFHNYQYTINSGWVKANIINYVDDSSVSVSLKDGLKVNFATGKKDSDGKEIFESVTLTKPAYRFWNSSTSRDHATMIKTKTTHDPCPPGYIIETSTDLYHYAGQRNKEAGFARAASDNSKYTAGYRFYGMYFNNAKLSDGTAVALYFPCAGARFECVVNIGKNSYDNMGYIYAVNAQSGDRDKAYNVSTDLYHSFACSLQYGASASSGTKIGWPGRSTTKKVNSQAYNVRCRRGKF